MIRMQYAHPDRERKPAIAKRTYLRKLRGEWAEVMAWQPDSSKYTPHQGKAECERRNAQANRKHFRELLA